MWRSLVCRMVLLHNKLNKHMLAKWVEHSNSLHKLCIPDFRSTESRSENLNQLCCLGEAPPKPLAKWHHMYVRFWISAHCISPAWIPWPLIPVLRVLQRHHLCYPSSLFWPGWLWVKVSLSPWQSLQHSRISLTYHFLEHSIHDFLTLLLILSYSLSPSDFCT